MPKKEIIFNMFKREREREREREIMEREIKERERERERERYLPRGANLASTRGTGSPITDKYER